MKTFLSKFVVCVFVVALAGKALAQEEIHDPIEPVNRGIFWFNDKADTYVILPVTKVYDKIVPYTAQNHITNFFHNLRYPRYLVANILEGKLKQAVKDTGRFLVNSTVGVVGIFDVAEGWGLPEIEKDIGLALQYDGVPAGPYIVLPFLGPSTLRDGIATIADFALDPLVIFGSSNVKSSVRNPVYYGLSAIKYLNLRSSLIEAVDTAKQSSLDYYLFVQGAYYQHRWGLLWDGKPPEEGEEINYTPADQYAKENGREAPSNWKEEIVPPGAQE